MATRKSGVYRSIVKRCLECLGDRASRCHMSECSIYKIKPGTKRSQSVAFTGGGKKLLPKFKLSNLLKSIRSECMTCTGGAPRDCTSQNCSFYPWRNGTSVLGRLAHDNPRISVQEGPNLDDCQEIGHRAA